jgi:hypothetical protein
MTDSEKRRHRTEFRKGYNKTRKETKSIKMYDVNGGS